jgi:cellulose synthase/poly-beta-1,6-N-acetylglucosamine synthase-like glycosyltransferase
MVMVKIDTLPVFLWVGVVDGSVQRDLRRRLEPTCGLGHGRIGASRLWYGGAPPIGLLDMKLVAYLLIAAPAVLFVYTYVVYPLLLRLLAGSRPRRASAPAPREWPRISITVPAFNEERQIRGVLDSLLRLDYPADRRQILVVSDASTDRTDGIVQEYADRGVELLRMPRRGGKTAAENAAFAHLRGEIVVNTDASIRFDPAGLKPLIAAFSDADVGVASGRDVSVARSEDDANRGESGYVGYEMWLRAMETRLGGIVGASGCCYAIRAELHRTPLPEAFARDFAAPLLARERGFRAVSVDEAVCFVPRTASLQREYGRKVRTMAGGMGTLLHFRHLLNPLRHGGFAWMLISHKLCRWLVPVALVPALLGLAMLSFFAPWAAVALSIALAGVMLAAVGWVWPSGRAVPRPLSVLAFAVASNVAVLHAWLRVLGGNLNATWHPTPRDSVDASPTRSRTSEHDPNA